MRDALTAAIPGMMPGTIPGITPGITPAGRRDGQRNDKGQKTTLLSRAYKGAKITLLYQPMTSYLLPGQNSRQRRKHNRNATETQQCTNRRTRNNSINQLINQLITQVHTAALINGGEFSRSHIRRDLCSMTIKRRRTARAGAENRSITGRISATVRGQGESSRADLWQCCTAGHSEERQRQRKQRRQRIAYTGRTVPEKSSENTGQGRRRS